MQQLAAGADGGCADHTGGHDGFQVGHLVDGDVETLLGGDLADVFCGGDAVFTARAVDVDGFHGIPSLSVDDESVNVG